MVSLSQNLDCFAHYSLLPVAKQMLHPLHHKGSQNFHKTKPINAQHNAVFFDNVTISMVTVTLSIDLYVLYK